jgi:DNA-binding response OmpR family regulator
MQILLVDDEARLRQAIARSLTARGYQVTEAGNAATALSLADPGNVDLLVLDVNLPDATGWDVEGARHGDLVREQRRWRWRNNRIVMQAIFANG